VSGGDLPASLRRFLGADTPAAWVHAAAADLHRLLIDHANCEKKAAASAMSLMNRYADRADLVQRMSRVAREELRHFERVHRMLLDLGLPWRHLSASRYAAGLRQSIAAREPLRLVDSLLVGAFIEARSAERFGLLMPRLPAPVAEFYGGLLAAETRHYQLYLALARKHRGHLTAVDVAARADRLRRRENELSTTPDRELRFHSGPPATVELSAAG
jgi:tRNA-(ms[2]io[6]A)-hydroxylase